MTGTKIAVDGAESELPNTALETLQDAVGGYIELVHLGGGKLMIVNEDGLGMKLPENNKATDIVASVDTIGQIIVGDVVVCDEADIE